MFRSKKFHFIAVGGIGMSALAKYLLELGCEVSGSDMKESKYCKKLEAMGAEIFIGHDEKNVPEDAIVVVSTAIKEDNPELIKAKEMGLSIVHRSDILKIIAEGYEKDLVPTFIGFAGTHGKTTTSGLCAFLLNKIGLKPSFAVGGIIPTINTNSTCANGEFFVAELDESDGSIVKYAPDVAVINNLEVDHADFYKDGFPQILDTFTRFINNMKPESKLIVNADCVGCQMFMEKNNNREFITFGLEKGDYQAKKITIRDNCTRFEVWYKNKPVGTLELSVFGTHNVYNALAVIVALLQVGIKFEKVASFFKLFTGMGRRFEAVGAIDSIRIFDDYAHHPSEIKAALEGARSYKRAGARIVTIFQPHRYTRFRALWEDFLTSFAKSDVLIVLDVFAAGDKFDELYNSKTFCEKINHQNVLYVTGKIEDCAEQILPILKENDTVITMGAGDITKMGNCLIELYRK